MLQNYVDNLKLKIVKIALLFPLIIKIKFFGVT